MNALYLDLMEKCLTNTIYQDPPTGPRRFPKYFASLREEGGDWPSTAHTMIGVKRLHQLREACETVLHDGIGGDFIETGIWRGGACIMMAAVLKAYREDRVVWCADSFEGLPESDGKYPADRGSDFHTIPELSVSLKQVKENFQRYGLLGDNVRFLKGWFKDTLPWAPIESLAILRLDGDMYESTMQSLEALYHKVSNGGFVIVDDYKSVRGCRKAIHDFFAANGIVTQLIPIDKYGVYWRK